MSEVLQPLESVKSGYLALFQGYGTTVQCRSHYCLCRVRRLNISSVWKKDEQPDFTKWTICWCRECYLRCDCEPSLGMAVWCVGKPIVRPEPTSTVHAQSWKMSPVGLAVITGAVVYYLVPTWYTRFLVTGKPFVWLPVHDPTPPGLDSVLVIPRCLIMPCFACDAMLPLCHVHRVYTCPV